MSGEAHTTPRGKPSASPEARFARNAPSPRRSSRKRASPTSGRDLAWIVGGLLEASATPASVRIRHLEPRRPHATRGDEGCVRARRGRRRRMMRGRRRFSASHPARPRRRGRQRRGGTARDNIRSPFARACRTDLVRSWSPFLLPLPAILGHMFSYPYYKVTLIYKSTPL